MSDSNSVFSETSSTKKYNTKNYHKLNEIMNEINCSGEFAITGIKKIYNLKNAIKKLEDKIDDSELPNSDKTGSVYIPILNNNLHIMYNIAKTFYKGRQTCRISNQRLREKIKELEADKSRLLYQNDKIKQEAKRLKKQLKKSYPEDKNIKAFSYFQAESSDDETESSDEENLSYDPIKDLC